MLRSCTFALFSVVALGTQAQGDSILVGSLMRTFTTVLPGAYDGVTPMPLVIAMHGGFGSGTQLEQQSQLSVKGDQEGFIVVYPDGAPSLIGIRTWNAGGCCGYAVNNNIDDVGFIDALIDSLLADYVIDPQRIYATGMSNGGFMSYRLACELSERIAAIAPVSATMTIAACQPARSVPVIGLHSYLDTSVPYLGGIGDGISNHYNSPQDSVQTAFALHANCAVLNDTILDNAEMTVIRWHECDCEQEMLLYMTHDGGHSWPGGTQTGIGDPPSQVIDANDLMWDFFQQYTLDCITTDVPDDAMPATTLQVRPNPTQGVIGVNDPDAQRISICDLHGRVLLSTSANPSTTTLDASALPAGVYVLRTEGPRGVHTVRFVRE